MSYPAEPVARLRTLLTGVQLLHRAHSVIMTIGSSILIFSKH